MKVVDRHAVMQVNKYKYLGEGITSDGRYDIGYGRELE